MKAHWSLLQGTDEWFEVRYRKIGGSTSKGLFVQSDTLLIELISEFLEEFEPPVDIYQDANMQRGNEFEPYARLELNKYTGHNFLQAGWIQCEEIDIFGISPDGITGDLEYSCEIKCPSAKKHTQTIILNEIPNDNIHQCLHYFTVNPNLKKHYFCSYRPENTLKPLFVKELTRESMINLGTNAKPVVKSVSEWVEIAKSEGRKLQEQIKTEIEKLKF